MTRGARQVVRLALFLVLIAFAWWLWKLPAVNQFLAPEHLLSLRDLMRSAWWGPMAFVAAYAVLSAFEFSGLILTVAGGIMFGFGWGFLLNTLGANLGASASYALARWLGRDALAALLGKRFDRVQRVIHTGGFLWLLRLRLIPVVPFNLLNIGAGLAGMPWRTFAAATALGILPGTAIYTFFADALVAGSLQTSRDALIKLFIAGGFLILLSFAPTVMRRFGRSSTER